MRFFVYLIVFFSFFDLFSQLPIMSPFALSLGASTFVAGLVVGTYSLANVFGNVISGFVTDKRGPFKILLIGLLTNAVALTLYSTVHAPWLLVGVRFVHGFTNGLIIPAAFTFLANRAEPEKRGKSVAISGAFVGMAAIAGPAYSGIVASIIGNPVKGTPTIMLVNGIIMAILALLAFLLLRSVKRVKKSAVKSKEKHVGALFRHPGIQRAFAGAFFLMFSQGVLALILPLKVESLGFDTKTTGTLLSTFGIVAILVFLLPINRVFDRVRPMITLAFGISLMGVSMLLLSRADELGSLYGTMALYGVGFAFLFPSINSLLIDSSEAAYRGKAYGYFYAFFSMGVVAGSYTIGALNLNFRGAFTFTGILLLIVAGYTIYGLFKQRTAAAL
ncbi:MFS transporter [Sporosarcina jeotgali]|uniref:MFS transporter n=1 Tax=Sporosarcina jeotgali TaxID=3020056 RepID=A0ABZ0KSB4_9BACL|nr:MFS transporter [Sporosarcina sp. B2O-1]WOV83166.1 MFS transporter [Sporosarcina sp. B2O-1]